MKQVCIAIILFTIFSANAQQNSAFGLKAGLNYNANGTYRTVTFSENPSRNIGFHVGVFAKAAIGNVYLRPELVYTRTTSDYTIDDLVVNKLDVPLLLGVNFTEFVSVFAGPSLQYLLDSQFKEATLADAESEFTIGLQAGVGLNFERFGIDVRYERGFTENEAILTGVPDARVDTRPEQFIIGFSVKL